ncbi:hypothetical protein DXG01_003389 [Tephrocybe rancida]|nr:hypothetical protein DXG01_003389 [Tephrocybe rancida]
MRSHTGDRPYKCQFCPDQFARSDLLSRHVNKCHESEKPPTASTTGRKNPKAARATTSKQTCDQQTAPTGPGHPNGDSPLSASSRNSSSSSYYPPIQQPYSTAGIGRDHFPVVPSLLTQLDNSSSAALDVSYPSTNSIVMGNDYTSRQEIPQWETQDAQAPQPQLYVDPSPTWNQNYYSNMPSDSDLQDFMSSISSETLLVVPSNLLTADLDRRRPSFDFGGSVSSGSNPSSTSSSSHLPMDNTSLQQNFQSNQSSFDPYTQHQATQVQAPADDPPAPFASAFGVLSIHDPDAAPFFSHLQPQQEPQMSQMQPPSESGFRADPNATPMSRDDVTWEQLINGGTPASATPMPLSTSTGLTPRRRAASMYNGRTPTALPDAFLRADYGTGLRQQEQQHDQKQEQGLRHQDHHRERELPQHQHQQHEYNVRPASTSDEDLSSWSAKIQSQRPPELRLNAKARARRQTVAGGERERAQHGPGPGLPPLRVLPAPALLVRPATAEYKVTFDEHRGSSSPVDPHSRSSSASTASWDSSGSESARRPSFKRLPSSTPLEAERERDHKHKRVLVEGGLMADAGNRRVVNLAERRRVTSAGAGAGAGIGVGDEKPFSLGLRPGFSHGA